MRRVHDFFAVIICNRHFGGGHEIQTAFVFQFEKICFEFWKLSGPKQRFAIDDKWRQSLAITMLPGMQVEHEIDQRSLKSRTRAVQNCESRSGDLGCPFKIQNPK